MATPPGNMTFGFNGDTLRVVSAEMLATALLVFVGCGTAVGFDAADTPASQTVVVALGFGFAYTTMSHIFGHISAAHMNPATTLAFLVARKIGMSQFVCYIVAQLLGSLIGAGVLDAVTGGDDLNDLGVTRVSDALTSGEAFGLEFVITFVYVITLFSIIDPEHVRRGSLQVGAHNHGFAAAAITLFAYKFTGASFNPVRTFGPAVVASVWEDHWVYWLGPLAGGTLAGLIYELCFFDKTPAQASEIVAPKPTPAFPAQRQPQRPVAIGHRPVGMANWARNEEDAV
eukprot:m.178844 g.178844  ORF g.178844 m.178844 type:complete len:286 (+) comp17986_c1_seq2:1837-2694(+)